MYTIGREEVNWWLFNQFIKHLTVLFDIENTSSYFFLITAAFQYPKSKKMKEPVYNFFGDFFLLFDDRKILEEDLSLFMKNYFSYTKNHNNKRESRFKFVLFPIKIILYH